VALIGDTFTLQLWVPKDPYNKANSIPCFKGDKSELKTVEPRWRFGMMLAASFSTLRAQGAQGPICTPPQAYLDGSLFARSNVRPGIHALRAELDGPPT